MHKLSKLNKNQKILIFGSFILVIGFILILIGKSLASTESTILRDRVIDNLSFENASIDYSNGVSTFTVDVTNDNSNIYNLKYISIIFAGDDGTTTKMIGYIGDSIEISETKTITASIDKDVTKSIDLEYVVEK